MPPEQALGNVQASPISGGVGSGGDDTQHIDWGVKKYQAYHRKYYTREQLYDSPSRRDGISAAAEARFRRGYCYLITRTGMKLNLPHITTVAAIDYCHRFYAVRSLLRNDRFYVACAALLLAGKVMESPKGLKAIIQAAWAEQCAATRQPEAVQSRLLDERFVGELREQLLCAERALLYTTGFTVPWDKRDVPHRFVAGLVSKYGLDSAWDEAVGAGAGVRPPKLLELAWNFLNDSLHTTLCLQYKGIHVAVAALYLTMQVAGIQRQPEVDGRAWWEAEGITPEAIQSMVEQMMDLYDSVGTSAPSAATAAVGGAAAAGAVPMPAAAAAALGHADAAGGAAVRINDGGRGGIVAAAAVRENGPTGAAAAFEAQLGSGSYREGVPRSRSQEAAAFSPVRPNGTLAPS